MKHVTTKTLDLYGYIKHQHFRPQLTIGVKRSESRIARTRLRTGRAKDHSAMQKKTRLLNVALCNLHQAPDKLLKFVTFKPSVEYRNADIKKANRVFTDFVRRFEYYLGYKPLYICLPEINDKNPSSKIYKTFHHHALFFNIPYIPQKIWEDIFGIGFVTPLAVPVSDGLKAVSYVLKYITKDSILNNRVLMSRALKRPIVSYNQARPDLPFIYSRSTIIEQAGLTITTTLYKKP